jgi:hypothetical protein
MTVVTVAPEERRSKDLKYSWVMAIGSKSANSCMVIAWLRGKDKDTRITWESAPDEKSCTVNINKKQFETYFSYCVLSGVKVTNGLKEYHAAFKGGPAGGSDHYWFEWDQGVNSDFYCMLK